MGPGNIYTQKLFQLQFLRYNQMKKINLFKKPIFRTVKFGFACIRKNKMCISVYIMLPLKRKTNKYIGLTKI